MKKLLYFTLTALTIYLTGGVLPFATASPSLLERHRSHVSGKRDSDGLFHRRYARTHSLTATAQVVSIPDPNLRAAIENALGKAPGASIAPAEMATLPGLEARNANISNLTGLDHATNLTRLSLSDNAITDISVLAGLTNLTDLSLADNHITDISVLAGLTNLIDLALGYNAITDHSILSGLTNLTEIDLRGTNTSDLSVLSGLTKLKRLFIDSNGISDLSPLAGLTNLTTLALNSNSISNLSPLRGLTNLEWVRLAGNDISDLSPLVDNMGLGEGDWIDVRDNPLSYLSLPIHTHIPTLESRGVTVEFDDRTHFNVGEPRTVRMIYFLPNDRPYRAEVVQRMKDEILKVQTFFAEQMEAHGYGRRTFRVETDAYGEPIVHRVDGKHPDSYYLDDAELTVDGEIEEMFYIGANMYLIVVDNSIGYLCRPDGCWGGWGGRRGKQGGKALVTGEVGWLTVAHELGHVFGLDHDFRDGRYLLSYGPGKDRLAACSAEFLAVHPYFNANIPIEEGDRPVVDLISPHSYPSDSKSVSIRARVSDPDGLHQVILYAKQPDNRTTVKSCRGLSGEKSAIIEFDYDGVIPSAHDPAYSRSTSLLDPLVHEILIEAVDAKGDIGRGSSFLLSDDVQPLLKISGDNQHGLPNTPLPVPFVVEVRNLDGGFPLIEVPIRFTVTAGGGRLSVRHTETDGRGRAESVLTLGPNLGTNTVTVSAAGIAGTVTFTAVATTPVEIPDPNLRAVIEAELRVPPNTPISPADMARLTQLFTYEAPGLISNLTGLAHANNLELLGLGEHSVSDLSPLAGLTRLEFLNVGRNLELSDLSPLAGLTNLTYLALWENSISDISALVNLTNLESLQLSYNSISDISVLAGLTHLKWLYLERNAITDISALAGLTNLIEMHLGKNHITDISALLNLTHLETLSLNNNAVSDISAVANLTNLTELGLGENNITDISPLAGLTHLTYLRLGGNNITDISPLVGLTNLTRLRLWENNIIDISPIAELTTLTSLALGGNNITDLSPLVGLTNLTWLQLWKNNITDLSSLVENAGLGAGDEVQLNNNPLNYTSIKTHILVLQSRGIEVEFTPRTPAPPLVISGDNQRGAPGAALEQPFVVEVRDRTGTTFAGVPVVFTVAEGDGTLSITNSMTDANGRAESTLTLGSNPGTNTVEVSVEGISQTVVFSAEATPPLPTPTTLSIASGDSQSGLIGEVLASPFVVEVRDQYNDPIEGVIVTFAVSAGGGSLSDTSVDTDANGLAQSTLTLGSDPGTNRVEVSVEGIAELVTFYAEATLPPPTPTTLSIASGDSQSGLIGEVLMQPFVVKVHDQYDDPMGGVTVTFAVSAGGGSLSDTSVDTDSDGLAETTLTLGSTPGTNTVLATVDGITEPVTFNAMGEVSDLVVEQVSVSKSSFVPGEDFTLSATVINQGTVPTNETTLRYYHSTDATISSSDTEIGTDTVSGLDANQKGNYSISLTAPTAAGAYYYGACVDTVDNEIITANNCADGVEITVERVPTELVKRSGDNQTGVISQVLSSPFVVEVRDQDQTPLEAVPVMFAVTGGGGMLSATNAITDADGLAETTLTLGSTQGTNTVSGTVDGIAEIVTFNAVGEGIEFDLSMSAGINLIHVPLRVTAVDGVATRIISIADLYDALGGASSVNFLITYDSSTQTWLSYFSPSDRGSASDRDLTDEMGIIASMKTAVTVRLRGEPLGIAGSSVIALNPGLNLVGLPLRDPTINRVSDLLRLDGIWGNVNVILLSDGGDFKIVGRAGDPGDGVITGGQGFILTAQQAATVAISGEGWANDSTAAPQILTGLPVSNTTAVVALKGSIVDEVSALNPVGFRVAVKNLSTGRQVVTTIADAEAGYRLAIVDIETMRAARFSDVLEISAQSTNPFIGVEPLRYTVTAKDVSQGWIQLPALVAYYIPQETELLANYPNPFNPETWIPYRLAEDAFVTLTIYDGSGRVVRTLDIGHRIAAVYESRSKAIYWDGRNDVGEQVASGVYFYTLTLGEYSQTRKMIILK